MLNFSDVNLSRRIEPSNVNCIYRNDPVSEDNIW